MYHNNGNLDRETLRKQPQGSRNKAHIKKRLKKRPKRRHKQKNNCKMMKLMKIDREPLNDDSWDEYSSFDGQTPPRTIKNPTASYLTENNPFEDTDDDSLNDEALKTPQRRKQQLTEEKNQWLIGEVVKHQMEKPVVDKGGSKALRAPICVVMGHVNSGKTKILDNIRNTKVQQGEVRGITQQIGATNISMEYIKQRTVRLQEEGYQFDEKIPGLLFIDTPGHESFSNLRSRGSSMCDIAVLVVDLMHGLEPQTIESLNMLRDKGVPFVVALNKIDDCYQWKPDPMEPFLSSYNKQAKATRNHFDRRLSQIIIQFAEQEINAKLYTHNKKMRRDDICLVPTSAITGDGIPDLLYLIQRFTKKRKIRYKSSVTKASVLEVKPTEGYGVTIEVIVSNGNLRVDDTIVICGMNGAIVSGIRALLLPHDAQEMRVKGEWNSVQSVSASVGVRIATKLDISSAVAGVPLFVVPRHLKSAQRKEIIRSLKEKLQQPLTDLFTRKISTDGRGVFVQSSTFGSLEALIEFLTQQKIPIAGFGIGNISKSTVQKACIITKRPEDAVILAFNVEVAPDAAQLANAEKLLIFQSEIIYRLHDMYTKYMRRITTTLSPHLAIFPVKCKILSQIHQKNPLILGVEITKGSLRINTPICAAIQNGLPLYLGRVMEIRSSDKKVEVAGVGEKVSVKIQGEAEQKQIQVGKDFAIADTLISKISRGSIDSLKCYFKEDTNKNLALLFELKKYFHIH